MLSVQKKRLIYHLYYTNEWFRGMEIIDFHFKCLSHFSYLFDESLFVIALDNPNDSELIMEAEKKIIDAGFLNVKFKITQNVLEGEAITFYNEVATQLKDLDGWTFFAHSKGISNPNRGFEFEDIIYWIGSMYYLSLGTQQSFDNYLFNTQNLSYGFPVVEDAQFFLAPNKYHWCYLGTMYWLNGQGIHTFMENNQIKLPTFNNRWYAEMFLGEIYPRIGYQDYGSVLGGTVEDFVPPAESIDIYGNTKNVIAEMLQNRPEVLEQLDTFITGCKIN